MKDILHRRPWLIGAFVALLLALHYVMAVGSKLDESTTSDELVHLTGGFVFDHFHDYRLHPENGILPQRWAALPAVLMGSRFPELDQHPWWTSNSWVMGYQFFYQQSGQDHFPRLIAARAMIALFDIGTGLLVFLWSRRFFGIAGGLVSLVLFAFSPTFLAHGALATSDACMTFCMLAAVGAWWRHLHDGGAKWWGLSAVAFGLACVAKFSAPLLLPMFAIMGVARAWHRDPLVLFGRTWPTFGRKFGAIVASGLGHGVVAVAIIWLFFGLRFGAFNPALPHAEHFIRPWEWIDQNIGGTGKILRAMAAARLLPEAYLYGMAYVVETAQVRSAFLNGDYSATGWPSFFLWAFLLKTTPALMIASLLAVLTFARNWVRQRASTAAWLPAVYCAVPLLGLFVVYWAVSITSHLNIGHRHIMPTYPVLFIACGVLGRWLTSSRRLLATGCAALLVAQVVESVRAAPHYISYFNVLGGAPTERHRHLVDSSLDWGQDLPRLKRWLDTNAAQERNVYLSYFGTGEPDYYGFRVHRLPFVNGFKLPRRPTVRLEPGVYCVGATMLEHVYSPVRGPWGVAQEREFEAGRAREEEFVRHSKSSAVNPEWGKIADSYELLRFARLCHYLRVRRPDADIGGSTLIYRLTQAELDAAVYGSLRDWAKVIEDTVQRR